MRYLNSSKALRAIALVVMTFAAQTTAVPQTTTNKKPVTFKTPSGYMAVDFPGHLGKLMLAPKQPGGMFVAYPNDGQDMASFMDEVKQMVVKMFIRDLKNPEWASASLPSHKGFDSEVGYLLATSDEKMEVQLVFYSRPEGVAYGYFAMRHKKAQDDDAKFIDANGKGVKAFDELAKTISSEPKQ